MNRLMLALVAAVALLMGSQGVATAVPIGVINGATQLNVTSFGTLTDLGVTVAPGGTAQVVDLSPILPSPIVFYDVTSVDLDPASTRIFHVGSILDLSTTATVSLSDFVINASTGFVLADVDAPGGSLMGAPVFAINKACSVADPCLGLDGTATVDGLELTLTAAAAGVLSDNLGIIDLTDAVVAVANSSFTPIPEPGTGLLALTGLVMLGFQARRRRSL
jgi:hypothetical protein